MAPTKPEGQSRGERALAAYVRAVARALAVSPAATTCEVSDTASGYIPLGQQSSHYPGRDLMLVWTLRHGWFVAPEMRPRQREKPLGYLGGAELLPSPDAVAAFVNGLIQERALDPRVVPSFPVGDAEEYLAQRLAEYLQ